MPEFEFIDADAVRRMKQAMQLPTAHEGASVTIPYIFFSFQGGE